VILGSGRVEDKASIKRIVSEIKSGGYTNLSGGMLSGFREVESTYRRGYVNRVLLLSDGLANRGISGRSEIAELVRERSRKYGVTISTFGVGNDFNENLMADIADYGKGNYYYIKNSEDIPRIFASELTGVRYLAGQDSKIRIKFPSDYLTVNKVFGYPYEIFGDEIMIDLKDIFAGQKKTILIKFDIRKKFTGKIKFRTDFEYCNPEENLEKVTSTAVNILEPVGNETDFKKGFAERVQQNVVVFEANEIMEQALKEADEGNYDEAKKKVKEGMDFINEQKKDVKASTEMERQEESLDNYGKELETANEKSEEDFKEMQKAGKYENYNTRKNNN
jgi:Ca-activated chloride channel family protein